MSLSRRGASVALAGSAGDDAWRRWLRVRLRAEGVDLRFWRLLEGKDGGGLRSAQPRRVPEFLICGDGIRPAMLALEPGPHGSARGEDPAAV